MSGNALSEAFLQVAKALYAERAEFQTTTPSGSGMTG
jgi:hypothetical protein